MELTEKRQGEIALKLIKLHLKEKGELPKIENIKRNLGNGTKRTGFSKEELTEFVIILAKELAGDFLSEVEQMRQV